MRLINKLSFLTICLAVVIVNPLFAQLDDDNIVVFPGPPDTARIQYLTSISNSVDITGKRSGFIEWILGADEGRPIVKPYGLRIHKGKLYICDSMLGGLVIIDLEKKSFNYFQPGGLGQLKKPLNCFVAPNGYLYVADAARQEIVIFDQQLKFVKSIGRPMITRPTDVVLYKDNIWVCDIKKQQVHIFSNKDFKYIRSFPDVGTNPEADNFLNQPTNISIKNDKIYVSDFGAFKIKVFSLRGEYLSSIGSYGRGTGQFVRPKGIALDKESRLYVVDAGFENVQMFDSQGKLLLFFGGSYEGHGNMWLPAKVIVDYDNLKYFQQYVHPTFKLKHLIFVTNQYGPDKISVYGFVEPK